jgi:hypothetical protein
MNDERFAPNSNPNRGSGRKEKQMNAITKATSVAVLVALGLALGAPVRAAETELVSAQTPWRVFLRTGPYVGRKDGKLVGRDSRPLDLAKAEVPKDWAAGHSPSPADGWFGADFDDSGWGRYQADNLADLVGGYGGSVDASNTRDWFDRFHLRTCFGINDPAAAQDMSLELAYRGGVVVYLNGKEVGRGHLPAGGPDAATFAEDYPAEAYVAEDGTTPLPGLRGGASPEPKWKDRYERRIRRLTLRLPPECLVKGANVLAVEVRRAPVAGPLGRNSWEHAGFHSARLLSASGKGAVAWTAAVERTYVWNAWPMETVTEKRAPEKPELYWLTFARGVPTRGLETGNPFDPLRPVRIAVPRNGTCAGVAVVSDRRGVKGVSAKVSPLAGPGGATLKPEAIEIRYAAQQDESPWCDVLLPAPPAEARNVPVWLLVNAPKDQAPGWYTGTLSLSANGRQFQVAVEVLVTAFVLPAPQDYRSMVGMVHSPDTLALHYGVKPWSDKHFALMEKTIAMMGQLGSDVVHVPVVLGTYRGVKTGMIRWVKQGDGYRRDYSALEKYLDLWTKHCGPPKALALDMWSGQHDPEVIDAREKFLVRPRKEKPLPKVTLLDPASSDMTELAAPWIADPAGEPFWRPVFEEVRAIVRRRGWPESVIMIGEPHDNRPSLRFVQLMQQWAPYVRWSVYSHFSGDTTSLGTKERMGEGRPRDDGSWVILPGLEVGYGVMPFEHMSPAMLPQDQSRQKMTALMAGSYRFSFGQASTPEAYRTVVWWTGNSGRHGMDYWPLAGGRRLFQGLGNIWGGTPISMTAPGPAGPLPTVRFQMYREAVQEAEAWLTIVGTCATRQTDGTGKGGPDWLTGMKPSAAGQDERAKAYIAMYLDAVNLFARWRGSMHHGGVENSSIPLAKLSLGWPGAIARAYEAAGELTGAKSEAKWDQPPATK